MDSTERNDRADDGPAVTTSAMSADPVLPPDDEPRLRRDPVTDPAGAARELPEASGGQAAEPDLADVPGRDVPGIAAARFEVDVDPEART